MINLKDVNHACVFSILLMNCIYMVNVCLVKTFYVLYYSIKVKCHIIKLQGKNIIYSFSKIYHDV